MNRRKYPNKAFSLIELSVVILVIGILIVGIMEGRDLVRKSSLSTARTLTKSSPVSGVKDLLVWFETSLEESFPSGIQDGDKITTWYDINPRSMPKLNATQYLNQTNNVTFKENVFGAIPAVYFGCTAGTNCASLAHPTNGLVGTFTIFVVEKRDPAFVATSDAYIVSGFGNTVYQTPRLSYSTSSGSVYAGIRNSGTNYAIYSNSEVSAGNLTIHTMKLDSSYVIKYWANGGVTPDATYSGSHLLEVNTAAVPFSGGNTYPNTYYFRIGNYFNTFSVANSYNGHIAEYIVYSRALNDDERQAVEKYLGQKYNITITG